MSQYLKQSYKDTDRIKDLSVTQNYVNGSEKWCRATLTVRTIENREERREWGCNARELWIIWVHLLNCTATPIAFHGTERYDKTGKRLAIGERYLDANYQAQIVTDNEKPTAITYSVVGSIRDVEKLHGMPIIVKNQIGTIGPDKENVRPIHQAEKEHNRAEARMRRQRMKRQGK